MDGFNLTDAEKSLSDLVDRAEAGETIDILRDGRLVAKLVPVPKVRQPIDMQAMLAAARDFPFQSQSAGDFIREMRDLDRY